MPRRMLTKGTSARIHVQLRNPTSGPARKAEMPLETFATNKSMGRVLFRRGGATIGASVALGVSSFMGIETKPSLSFGAAAGIVLEVLP